MEFYFADIEMLMSEWNTLYVPVSVEIIATECLVECRVKVNQTPIRINRYIIERSHSISSFILSKVTA
jgi:hypothetical protein